MKHRHANPGRSAIARRRAIACGVVAAVALAAGGGQAGGSPPTEPPASEVVADRVQGGEVTMVSSQQQLSLDPQIHRTSFVFTEGPMMAAIFGHLAYMEPDTGEVVLYFLESLESTDDFTVWTMRLHDGITFSDGTPLNAEAIEYNIVRAGDPATGSRFQSAAEGLELAVLDDLTLQVTLPGPDATWASSLVANFAAIGSPAAMEATSAAGDEVGSNPVGAGPFMVTEWEPGQTMVVERNPYFADFQPGQPFLDRITFETVPDQSQQVDAMATGSAQLASPNGAGSVQNMVETDGVETIVTRTSGGSNLLMNQSRPPFDDARARRAIQLALDPAGAADAFARGTEPVTTMFGESSPFYDPAYAVPAPDPEEAQRLFDELAAEGKPLEFVYTTVGTAEQAAMSDYLLAQIAQYENVTVEIDVRTGTEYIASGTAGEYEMRPYGLYFSDPIPLAVDALHPDGTTNTYGYDNDTVRQALESLKTIPAEDIAAQTEVWNVVQEEFLKDLPWYWVGQGVIGFAHADDIVVTETLNYGNYPLWGEVGFAA